MSKNGKSQVVPTKQPRRKTEKDGAILVSHPDGTLTVELTTKRGVPITITPIPPLLLTGVRKQVREDWKAEHGGKLPTVPKYRVSTAGGDIEEHEHDATTIADSSPEVKKEWEAYHAEVAELNERINQAAIYAAFMECVTIRAKDDKTPTLPNGVPENWQKRAKRMGLEVIDPEEDSDALRVQYLLSSAATPVDINSVMEYAVKISAPSPSEVNAVEETFRHNLEGEEAEESGTAG